MAKAAESATLDATLQDIIDNGTRLAVCSAEPANQAGIAAVTIMDMAASGLALSDNAGGRRLTVAEHVGTASAEDTPTHVVLHDNSSRMPFVTTCTGALITNGASVTVPAWTVDNPQPA